MDPTFHLNDVAVGPGMSVAVGINWGSANAPAPSSDATRATILNSIDGKLWTPNSVGLSNNLHRVAYVSDRFLALGDDGNLLASFDGLTWTTIVAGTDVNLLSIAVTRDHAVAVGNNGHILHSIGNGSWLREAPHLTNSLIAVAYGAGQFVAIEQSGGGISGGIQVSHDGSLWSSKLQVTNYLQAVVGCRTKIFT